MGLFGKNNSGSGQAHGSDLNAFLGAGTEYRGRLEFVGTVRIDGIFHGEIVTDGTLILGREAVVRGQLRVGHFFSNGLVVGDVEVTAKAVLQKHAVLQGSLRAPALVVEEGAAIEGQVEMSRPENPRAAKSNTTQAAEPVGMEAAAVPQTSGSETEKAVL